MKDNKEVKNRPILPSLITEGNLGVVELFQNEVIRPVIKMQHEVLLALFYSALSANTVGFENQSRTEKLKSIDTLFSKDQKWRSFLIGAIVGQFTVQEIEKFNLHKKEISKRILQICKERVISVVGKE